MDKNFDIVLKSFYSCFDFVTEYSFILLENKKLDSIGKTDIFRKVVEIREHLEYCEKLWEEIRQV